MLVEPTSWDVSVIADSAQFSSSVIELSEASNIGTMLTMQTSVGFAITLASVHLIPYLVEMVGWEWAFAPLAAEPFLVFGRWRACALIPMPSRWRTEIADKHSDIKLCRHGRQMRRADAAI